MTHSRGRSRAEPAPERGRTAHEAGARSVDGDLHTGVSVAPPAYGIDLSDRGAVPRLRRACRCDGGSCPRCGEEHVLRRAALSGHEGAGAGPARADAGGLLAYLGASAGRGQPLAAEHRASFERSLGIGLGGVRVVADPGSAAAAAALGARAFTLGSTIWFGRGEYRPASPDGRRLLAHEVAHVAQQRAAAPAIQREVVVGSASDPAEASADRAAEAMLRGEPASLHSGASAVLRRTCTASSGAGLEPGERLVTCPEGSWRVAHRRQRVPARRQAETRFDANFRWDDTDIAVDVTICRGGTRLLVTLSGNVPEAAMQALLNAVTSTAIGRGISLRPSLALVLTRSESWEVSLSGGPSFDAETGAFQSAGGTLTFRTRRIPPISLGLQYQAPPPGSPSGTPGSGSVTVTVPTESQPTPVPRIDCSRLPDDTFEDVFRCRRILPGEPARPATPALPRSPSTTIYVLFAFETAQIVGWRFEGDPTIYPPGDRRIHDRVMELILLDGYQPSAVIGRASPEGLRRRQPPSPRFAGNDPLSQARAGAAHAAFFDSVCFACPTYQGRPIIPIGLSELYSPPPVAGREVEGPPLDRAATEQFLATDPLRPGDRDAFRSQPAQAQREQAFSMLRRAEIRLERSPILLAARPGSPGRAAGLGDVGACPPEVEAAARSSFRLDIFGGGSR